MNDDVKAALESLRREMADGDPEWWVREQLIFAHIDGEPARIAAAFVEVREACARHIWAMSRRHTAEELMDYVAARVAPYKKLRLLEFIEQVPKSSSGKILRRMLVDQERAKK